MKVAFWALSALLVLHADAREFKGQNGKVIEAEIVSKSPGKVVLKLKDDKEIEIPISSLSEADQLYVAVWESPEEKAKQLKAVKLDEALEAQGYVALPVTMEEGHLVVEAQMDDQEVNLMIDHRNENPVLSKVAVEAKGIKMKAVEGGGQVIGRCTPDLVGNGERGMKLVEFLVADMPNLPAGIDGMIGGKVFVDHSARLDFGNMKLWIKVK